MSDRTQMLSVEMTREEVERLAPCVEAGLSEDTVEHPAPFALKTAHAKLRAALSQPEHQGDPDYCVHSKAVLGCPGCLSRLKRQAAMAFQPPAPVLSEEERERLNKIAFRISHESVTPDDWWDCAATDLRDLASREHRGEEEAQSVIVDFLASWRYCPVSTASNPSRACLEDAAKQLLAALPAQPPAGEGESLRERLFSDEALEAGTALLAHMTETTGTHFHYRSKDEFRQCLQATFDAAFPPPSDSQGDQEVSRCVGCNARLSSAHKPRCPRLIGEERGMVMAADCEPQGDQERCGKDLGLGFECDQPTGHEPPCHGPQRPAEPWENEEARGIVERLIAGLRQVAGPRTDKAINVSVAAQNVHLAADLLDAQLRRPDCNPAPTWSAGEHGDHMGDPPNPNAAQPHLADPAPTQETVDAPNGGLNVVPAPAPTQVEGKAEFCPKCGSRTCGHGMEPVTQTQLCELHPPQVVQPEGGDEEDWPGFVAEAREALADFDSHGDYEAPVASLRRLLQRLPLLVPATSQGSLGRELADEAVRANDAIAESLREERRASRVEAELEELAEIHKLAGGLTNESAVQAVRDLRDKREACLEQYQEQVERAKDERTHREFAEQGFAEQKDRAERAETALEELASDLEAKAERSKDDAYSSGLNVAAIAAREKAAKLKEEK